MTIPMVRAHSLARRDAAAAQPGAAGRRLLLLPILLAHAGAFLWAARGMIAPPAPRPTAGSLILVDVAIPAEPHTEPAEFRSPPIVVPPVVVRLPVPEVLPVAMPAPVAETENVPIAGGCDLTETVQTALRERPDAQAAVAALPVQARSVANAVMLWDGGWIVPKEAAARSALIRIRVAVAETIAEASDDCQAQLQSGPRLLTIPGARDTVLALGSGRWRWGDLLERAPVAAVAAATGSAGAAN